MDNIDVVLEARLCVVNLVTILAKNLGLGMADFDMFFYFLERFSTYRAYFLFYMDTLDMFLHVCLSPEGALTPFFCALYSGEGRHFLFGLSRFQDGDNHRAPLLAFWFERFTCVGF